MTVAKMSQKCPYCKETINAGATRCKHCHADLSAGSKKKTSALANLDNFRTGFLCGILFTLILTVLGYFHFFAGE